MWITSKIRYYWRRLRIADWPGLGWVAFGYAALAFFTTIFSFACYEGRQGTAVDLLLICTVLLHCLPPHRR